MRILKLLPLQGEMLLIPRVLPWARSFCPFRACGALASVCFCFASVLLLLLLLLFCLRIT